MTAPTRAACEKTHEKVDEEINNLFKMSIPTFVRGAIITSIGFLFLGLGGVYLWSVSTYATREEVKEMRSEWREDLREIKTDLKQILREGRN